MGESLPLEKSGHVCHRLIAKLGEVHDYPPGTQKIEDAKRIPRTAFFPGGYGLWDPDGTLPHLPMRPIVIVGNNWGTPEDHAWAFSMATEYSEAWPEQERRQCPTWWNLLQILRAAGVRPEDCFFTNAYVGLKANDQRNVGQFPSTPAFDDACRVFLRVQLTELRPTVVMALGKAAIRMLSQVVPELKRWTSLRGGERTLREIHTLGLGVIHHARVDSEHPEFSGVAIAHTCDPRNLSKGFATEIELLQSAVQVARAADA